MDNDHPSPEQESTRGFFGRVKLLIGGLVSVLLTLTLLFTNISKLTESIKEAACAVISCERHSSSKNIEESATHSGVSSADGVKSIAWDFEQPPSKSNNESADGWAFIGGAGLDNDKGNAHAGTGNAWVRQSVGWNAIIQLVHLSDVHMGFTCTAKAWLRTSSTLTDGYMSIRNGDRTNGTGDILIETKLIGARPKGNEGDKGYQLNALSFVWPQSGRVVFYVGLWGNGSDSWIQIDDAAIGCSKPF